MLIIGQRIRPGREQQYRAWQQRVIDAASQYPGYRGAEVKEPNDVQPDWVIVYRFDSVPTVQNWLNSATRQGLLNEAADLFDGPGTRQVISQSNEISDPLVTVMVTNRVAADQEQAFLAWRASMAEAESRYPGFRGSEVFRPITGLQDEWTTVYRFDTAEHLDAWMTSPERRKLLSEGGFGDFTLRTIDQSFGNWFAFEGTGSRPPSDFKSSIAVWLGLYPTVVLLTMLGAGLHMPFWLGMLVGNLVSSLVMSYLIMPHYVNRILRWWLAPSPSAPQPATDIKGLLLVVAINGVWAAVFYLLTVKAGVTSL
ncbi:MAG: antibiotic biosynthesis monooxygenase [Mycobacterium sp.]|nr:antibiotic biosynthesis monooxygenase [Mycobacterium sp.]